MPQAPFHVTDKNPNDEVGGGGCLCDPQKVTDCCAPFVVVPTQELEYVYSPHIVIGARCVARISEVLAKVQAEDEANRHFHQRPKVTEKRKKTEVPEV